jgi:hypothetical protein
MPCKYNNLDNNILSSHHGMRERNQFIEKGSFYYSLPPKYTRMWVFIKNLHLQKYQQPLDIIVFSLL